MSKRIPLLVLATILGASLTLAAGPFETYQTDRNICLFYNITELSFTGLRVTFTGPVEPVYLLGIGADLSLVSNENGVLTFSGSIPPYGIWEIDWPLDGGPVADAAWLAEDGTEVAIDVHAPMARMLIRMPPEVPGWCSSDHRGPFRPFYGDFDGMRSTDPDGLPLTFYEWDWSDLVHLDGAKVRRLFRSPGWYWVTLTVWDVDGLSDSVTESFYIPPWSCDDD